MKKAVNRFVFYALLAIIVLLTVLLGVINGASFTMAADDADHVTEMIASQNGELRTGPMGMRSGLRFGAGNELGRFDAMGTGSPELTETMRFFTVRFTKKGNAKLVAYRISAVTEDEALAWAASLQNETTGWTNLSYRYRVYQKNGDTYVTVIDQSRELLPSYRILLISLIGEIVCIGVSFAVLKVAAKRLFEPIEEADRKQKRFIADAEAELKVPLTVIAAETELMERESGPTDQTRSIHRQVARMTDLTGRIGRLAVFTDETNPMAPLGTITAETVEQNRPRFSEKGLALTADVQTELVVKGDADALREVVEELFENAYRYAKSAVSLTLSREGERITLRIENDTDLPEGAYEQAFDRFVSLHGQDGGTGLGLARVRETLRAMDGRAYAEVRDGKFIVKVEL